jgi:catechol 2,3-dioxygenase-like lactoylglutathione lyase family enzyme
MSRKTPHEHGRISRRSLLTALPAVLIARRAPGQAAAPPIQVRRLTSFTLNVSDVGRSVDFYQGLFGMPVQARQGTTVLLRLGAGPQFLALSPAGTAPPRIDRFSLSVNGFAADRALQQLTAHGLTTGSAARGAVTFSDPDGIVVQLHDTSYCGGDGALGNMCRVEPAAKKGLLAARDWSHLTVFTPDGARSNAFYQRVFGLNVQARQGPTAPLLGVGDKIQFLMFAGGGAARGGGAPGGGQPRPASINHICLNLDAFDRDGILKTLQSYGIKPRGDTQGTPPLISYVSTRMPNRGGAPEGTPELYFTDPDGLLVQIQDTRYCGGGGYLGDVCA